MKIVIVPDKFKGSLTCFEVCNAISEGLKKCGKAIESFEFPMADGGDGFAAVMKHYFKTETIYCDTVDPLARHINVAYEWNEKDSVAIIELAVASGLVLLNEDERNPLMTSTYGTGILIKNAVERGAKKIILGLGGSATNDAGTGILEALGFQFTNEGNEPLSASGEKLSRIKNIMVPAPLPNIKFEIACDVQNVLYGQAGAAYVYAPQKGADSQQVKMLDQGLKNFAAIIEKKTGKNISAIPGTGAAGGIAAGLLPFFDVEMKKGIEMIVDASRLIDYLKVSDLVITGEGKIDEQSSEGKVVGYIAGLAKQYQVPCVAFCGELQLNEAATINLGLQKAISIKDNKMSKEYAMKNAGKLLVEKTAELIGFL